MKLKRLFEFPITEHELRLAHQKHMCIWSATTEHTPKHVVFWPFASKTRLLGLRAEARALIMLSLTHLSSQNITSELNITSNYDIRYHSWRTAQSVGRPLETTAVWALLWLQWRFICLSLLSSVPGKLKMKFSLCSARLNLFFLFFCIILRLKPPFGLSCDKKHPLSICPLARRLHTRIHTRRMSPPPSSSSAWQKSNLFSVSLIWCNQRCFTLPNEGEDGRGGV